MGSIEAAAKSRTPARRPAFAVPRTRTWRPYRVVPLEDLRRARYRLPASGWLVGLAAPRTRHRPGVATRRPPRGGAVALGCSGSVGPSVLVRLGDDGVRSRGRSPTEAAHPDGEVVLHDLADLRLGQHRRRGARTRRVLSGSAARPPRGPGTAGVSASSRSSRRPARQLRGRAQGRASDHRGSRREIVEWSTPDCWASCRWDIFLALSWARSHSLKARPFWCVIRCLGAP